MTCWYASLPITELKWSCKLRPTCIFFIHASIHSQCLNVTYTPHSVLEHVSPHVRHDSKCIEKRSVLFSVCVYACVCKHLLKHSSMCFFKLWCREQLWNYKGQKNKAKGFVSNGFLFGAGLDNNHNIFAVKSGKGYRYSRNVLLIVWTAGSLSGEWRQWDENISRLCHSVYVFFHSDSCSCVSFVLGRDTCVMLNNLFSFYTGVPSGQSETTREISEQSPSTVWPNSNAVQANKVLWQQ